jgi:hypothetical protein
MEASSSDDEENAGARQAREAGAASVSYAAAVRAQADDAVAVGSKRKGDRRGATKHKRQPSCTVPAVPPATPAASVLPMVGDLSTADVAENYTEDEKALNTFQKLHPLLSLESTSQRALQLVANLVDTTEIPTVEMPCIPKSYDDRFLAPPSGMTGERACCLGNKCIGLWMAIFRYGEGNDRGFVCKEFLLPEQQRAFEVEGTLPKEPAKCLLCSRYYITYQYRVARCNPNFVADSRIPVQAYTNVMGHTTGESIPSSSSFVGGDDGYHPSVCLAVDSDFANTEAGRGPMGTMLWRPFVAFHSGHYKYVSTGGNRSIVQIGVSADTTPHFGPEQVEGGPAPGLSPVR